MYQAITFLITHNGHYRPVDFGYLYKKTPPFYMETLLFMICRWVTRLPKCQLYFNSVNQRDKFNIDIYACESVRHVLKIKELLYLLSHESFLQFHYAHS